MTAVPAVNLETAKFAVPDGYAQRGKKSLSLSDA
jgi:hypothetical protein